MRKAMQARQFTAVFFALSLVAAAALFSGSANAACSHAANNKVVPVSNWTQFLKNGLSAGSPAPTSGPGADPSIVGLWHVFLVSVGQPFDEGFDQWHSDGTEILNDTAPPQPANGAGTVCLGVYKKTGPTYQLRHPFWSFNSNGNLAGSGVLLETVTMDTGGKSYHGTFEFDAYDLSNNLVFQATGEVSATRITVD